MPDKDSDEWKLALDIEEGWRRELEVQIRGGPKAKCIDTYDRYGRRIKGRSKSAKPKNWRAKRKSARKRIKTSRKKNRKKKGGRK